MDEPNLTRRVPGHRDSEATRSALLGAAVEIFARDGFDGATVGAIAGRAGVNRAMISYHFGGKRGLYAAALMADIESMMAPVATLRASSRPARERLETFVTVFGELHLRRPSLAILFLREILDGGARLEETALPRFVVVFTTLREIVEQGVADGTFRRVDPFLTHQTIVGSLLFFFASRPFRDRMIRSGRVPVDVAPDPESYVALVRELVVRGLDAQGGEAARGES